MDSIIIQGTEYVLPSGYTISLSARENSYKMTMANGEVRIDLGAQRWKAKITYEVATQEIFNKIMKIRDASLEHERLSLCLQEENKKKTLYSFNIIFAPTFQFKIRQSNLYLYSNLSIDLE